MKILRISVKNIASLVGLQTVDFTQEPLRSAGLFGISGPTGSGKSSLLDAVCLALFDATPRLKHVGNLSEIHTGEKQSDRRNLLRRGTAAGFAEVAFTGVDQQTWTARWSVRRSRNRTDGKLQPSEMTLFRGNIAPGADGAVEAGGKKTLVQAAIVEKIGLTFEQFTRAVLLAQNEFATFLKASDKHRAEILQALTGTEQFERISRAVFARASTEKKAVETLQLQLSGNEALSSEKRRQAEEEQSAARKLVRQVETNIDAVKQHVAWFENRTQKQQQLADAEQQRDQAKQQREVSAERRGELEQTETVLREARTLWTTHRDRLATAAAAESAVTAMTAELAQQTEQLQTAAGERAAAENELKRAQQDEREIQSQLRTARSLDVRLQQLEESVAGAEGRLQAAQQQQTKASESLVTTERRRDSLQNDQRERQTQLKTVSEFAVFADESARWSHLLNDAVAAGRAVEEAAEHLERKRTLRIRQQRNVLEQRVAVQEAEEQWKAVQHRLQTAEEVERGINTAALNEQREACHQAVQVLQSLESHLQRQQKLTDEVATLDEELAKLQHYHQEQSALLSRLQEDRLPQAEQRVVGATAMLERIEAALDDHAERLRNHLQDDQPCPVCGSIEHPYREHPPDTDDVAVAEAQRHVAELEQERDALRKEAGQLQVAVETAVVRIEERTGRRKECRVLLKSLTFDDGQHPSVAEVLALEASARQEAVQDQLEDSRRQLAGIAEQVQAGQEAAARTGECRQAELRQREALELLRKELSDSEKNLAKCEGNEDVAGRTAEATRSRHQDAMVELGTLWSGLPDSRRQFDADAQAFCEKFFTATATCKSLSGQLQAVASDLKSIESQLAPLRESAEQAERTLAERRKEHGAVVTSRDELQKQRQGLFEGRAADEVESEVTVRREKAELSVQALTASHHQLDKSRQSAEQNLKNAEKASADASTATAAAERELLAWLDRFNERYTCERSLEEIEQILSRDEQWIADEERFLKQLDDAVIESESRLRDRTKQLEQHQQQRPTVDDEEVVRQALAGHQEQLQQVKDKETAALARLASDDARRADNRKLAEQLTQQQAVADPWLKLNELIGSKEGDKFRMIAQRRTLDILVSYANFHLRRLAGRYQLERLTESLNLVVIDEQMGDERRSVHSLSGGESFLVSLALALSLASLTSSRMKIESLFIDEGFGSLDPETLNTAMGALMHLESQGRKVGVISHVAEMTDAIPVQVRVVRRQGGAAVIQVQGADVELTATDEAAPAAPEVEVEIENLATRITEILRREQGSGSHKVSMYALRKELGCESRQLKAAQRLLDGRVTVEGRSLRLL